jgi:GTP diphosphokinase / guanosine-3',5'-bis(diphosphate) 3'-diphosphatase
MATIEERQQKTADWSQYASDLVRETSSLHPHAVEDVQRAIAFAQQAHEGQFRESGDPYIVHPLEVAAILTDLQMDASSITAALLHDTLEDCGVPLETLESEFGTTVAHLVDGVTKLRRIKQKSNVDRQDLAADQAANLRKMFLAMVDDIRVVIIKLADRLHNMRTLDSIPPEKQQRKARETLDIFAPLANRLGIWQLKWQLEDLSFRYIDPDSYHEIARLISERRASRAEYLERVVSVLRDRLKREGIEARITGRPKHIFSIYSKMEEKHRTFDQIYDLRGVRIIVKEVSECYHVLGTVHSIWRPIPGEFDDYVAMPKGNLYQSLHTAVVGLDGQTLEIQIRTEEMHRVAEFGIAAHWRYKEGAGSRDPNLDARIAWLRQATDWREDVEDAEQFVDSVKSDVFPEMVYVFTPKGDIVSLPRGATPVDFAYQIHSEIGHRCRGAKVDGRLVPLDYQLRTGEQVEILTAKQGGPSRDWLNPHLAYVATQRARQKIRHWFRRQQREEMVQAGREILDRELRRLGIEQESYGEIAELFKYSDVTDFMAAVGYGEISPSTIAHKIDDASAKDQVLHLKAIPEAAVSDIRVDGVGDLLTRIGACCNPVPGDRIVGYITRGKGITIHRADCPNVLNLPDTERLIDVRWGKVEQAYPVVIQVEAFDRSGLLRDVAAAIADLGISMSSVNVVTNKDNTATLVATVGIRSVRQLSELLTNLQNVKDVLDVRRKVSG